jgi:D-aminopeptidase
MFHRYPDSAYILHGLHPMTPRPRLRDLNITIGTYPTGPHNAITDVPDVLVGHTTLIYDEPRAPALHPQRGASVARTGVTVIVPRRGEIWRDNAPAGIH